MLASMPYHSDLLYEFNPQIVSQIPTSVSNSSNSSNSSSNSNSNGSSSISSCEQPKFQSQSQQLPISHWPILSPYYNSTDTIYTYTEDRPNFDCYSSQQFFTSSPAALPMQCNHPPHFYPCRLENGQDIPRTITNTHHRESSFSSLGSAGPASPFITNIANPQIVGDIYDFNEISSFSTPKIFTTAQTHQSHEAMLVPQFSSNFQSNSNISLDMLSMPEISYQDRPQERSMVALSLAQKSPSTTPLQKKIKQQSQQQQQQQQQNRENQSAGLWMSDEVLSCDQGYRNMSKFDRAISEVYEESLYSHNPQMSAAPSPSISTITTTHPLHSENFGQRLQNENVPDISASSQTPLMLSNRECTPFHNESPLVARSDFSTSLPRRRIGTAFHLREQQKAESDARVLQEQLLRTSTTKSSPTTISPKDVDMIYREDREDLLASVAPNHQKTTNVIPSYQLKHESIDSDEDMSQQCYSNIATTRCTSSTIYSSSQPTVKQNNNFNFTIPVAEENVQCMSQQYSFLQPQAHRQATRICNSIKGFQNPQPSIELRGSDYESETRPMKCKKPVRVSANTGTYTCTYHGCTLRFDTPARLQRHKREGHRSSSAAAAAVNGIGGNGMTSAAHRNSQAGPHRCDRINPSTGKPCNTIFSRPYDLTRHEDTIHNTQKQKVYCPLCEDEKSFSRNDALTRHMRVVHPEYIDTTNRRRRGLSG